MRDHDLNTLEWPKILERLAAFTAFPWSAEKARALRPSTDLAEVQARLAETEEARRLLALEPGLDLGGVRDLRPLLKAASHGATLAPADLLAARDTIQAARRIRRLLLRRADGLPHLARHAGRMQEFPELEAEIERCLDEAGEVKDDASPTLRNLRMEIRRLTHELQARLQGYLTDPRYAPYLQEPLITMRGGRFVLPVKAEHKGKIPGLVHDSSASGATLFIEPLPIVEMGNRLRALQAQEEKEVARILAALSAAVGARAEGIWLTLEALADLDLALAKARYAIALRAERPEIVPWPEEPPEERTASPLWLRQARHPLLDPQRVVPIDVTPDPFTFILVLTGPNTGGKTVTLKTVGLLAVMAQSGLHIPAAEGSRLPVFDGIYADIGDEQSIEQNLSTFSAHLLNILGFLESATARSLALLDELGAGTDPMEGAALARAILEHFHARKTTTLVATHFPELKLWAQTTPGAINASMEFDPETLAPTYRLRIGLPGRSNAFLIARRLGMPEALIDRAQGYISPQALRLEALLAEAERLRAEAARAHEEAKRARAVAQALESEWRERLAQIEAERERILREAREQIEALLQEAREEIERIRRPLRAMHQAEVEAARRRLEALQARMRETLARAASPMEAPAEPAFAVGDRVWVRPLQMEGEILSLEGEEADVQVGRWRLRMALVDLERRERPQPAPSTPAPATALRPPQVPLDFDLRGMRVEEALPALEKFLDEAFLAGMPFVRIIHGKGTGALRRAVRERLKTHPHVESMEPTPDDGATIVRFAR
ncbi:endonuclease MutS2 [Thermoflexus sp.]|uniref:endonuclease MutS2 n=1 Tax=Thermoflexus sp. TaxID=1969742 RepID=UPI002ADDDC2A|nr:endonuclease MutS2 [Thermoflexus sp.]